MFSACRRELGDEATVFVAPSAEQGPLDQVPIVDTQGIGISASARDPRLATEFLSYIHADEQRASLWHDVRLFSADRRWQGPDDPADRDYAQMWSWYAEGPNAPYLPNLIPLDLHYRIAAEIGQAVLARRINGREAGVQAWERSREWRAADPEGAETFGEWAETAARGGVQEDFEWAG
jgi:hypothetical protein